MPDVSTDDGRSWHAEFDRCRIAFGYVCHVHVCVDMLCPWETCPRGRGQAHFTVEKASELSHTQRCQALNFSILIGCSASTQLKSIFMQHGSRIDRRIGFVSQHVEADLEHVADDADYLHTLDGRPIEYLPDASQSIVSTNDSPDIPFNFTSIRIAVVRMAVRTATLATRTSIWG